VNPDLRRLLIKADEASIAALFEALTGNPDPRRTTPPSKSGVHPEELTCTTDPADKRAGGDGDSR
jgi:hypothetical protein